MSPSANPGSSMPRIAATAASDNGWPSSMWKARASLITRSASIPTARRMSTELSRFIAVSLLSYRKMADRLDAMAVGIEHEGREIVRMISGAQSGGSVIASARFNSGFMEAADARPILRAETDMRAGNGTQQRFLGDRKLDSERRRHLSIV